MKNWIINENELTNEYLIVTEKSIWISEQLKQLDINELIENKNLGSVKSFRYDQLKEITLVETDFTIEFKFKDKDEDEESFKVEKTQFGEIRAYLKLNLKGISVKNYSLLKQVLPQLSTFALGIVFFLLTYQTAIELDNGIEIPESRKSSIIKKIVFYFAEFFGIYGTIIIGVIFIITLIFLINRKLQNPKKGEILILGKFVSLKQ